ncbi:MAG: NUDIX domain-containing protein [Saprospiraceae bacterium]
MIHKNPWKTLSVKEVYDNPWINITHREVLNPSGQNGIYGKVHFKNIAVGVLPLDEENNTWLVGQYRYTLEKYSWEIPEGGCIEGIEPLQAAKNELQEETGIIANKWTKILDIHTSNSVTDEFGICYLAQGLTFGKSSPEPCEELRVKKLKFEEVFEMVMNGKITDSLSIATIMKVKLMLFF